MADVRSWVNDEWDSFLSGGRPKAVAAPLPPTRTSRWGNKASILTSPLLKNPIISNDANKYLELSPKEVEIAHQYACALLGTVRGQLIGPAELVTDWSLLRCFTVPNKPSQWPWLFEHHIVPKEGYNVYMAPHILLAHELLRNKAAFATKSDIPTFSNLFPSPEYILKPPEPNAEGKVQSDDPKKSQERCIRCRVSMGQISIAPDKQICMDCARPSELRSVPSIRAISEYDPSDPLI